MRGFSSFWLSQITGPDALTALAVVGREVPDLELGTSIVPLYGGILRARTAGPDGAGGVRWPPHARHRPSHQLVVEGVLGESYAKPRGRLSFCVR